MGLPTFPSIHLSAHERRAASRAELEPLQSLVDDLRARLAISEPVVVSLVPSSMLMMSVEAPLDRTGVFRLAIEGSFLDILTEAELEAAIAHELGHVWVFTHHPYLQTERLANDIAMRVVSRENLERVYEKVWNRGETKGDIFGFLGPRSADELVTSDRVP